MTTYYCHTLEEALMRAKVAGKKHGCHFGGIVLKSGKRGFAIYREGKVIEQYSVIRRDEYNSHQNRSLMAKARDEI